MSLCPYSIRVATLPVWNCTCFPRCCSLQSHQALCSFGSLLWVPCIMMCFSRFYFFTRLLGVQAAPLLERLLAFPSVDLVHMRLVRFRDIVRISSAVSSIACVLAFARVLSRKFASSSLSWAIEKSDSPPLSSCLSLPSNPRCCLLLSRDRLLRNLAQVSRTLLITWTTLSGASPGWLRSAEYMPQHAPACLPALHLVLGRLSRSVVFFSCGFLDDRRMFSFGTSL